MANKKGLLEDVKQIRKFLVNLELSDSYLQKGGNEELLTALRTIGNIEGILTFHEVMLNSIKREIESLHRDLAGDEKQSQVIYTEEKIYG